MLKKEYHRKYYIKNREIIKERSRQWVMDNPEYVKKYKKQWSIDNKEKESKRKRIWNKNNPEKVRELKKRYCINNPEKVKECQKQWAKNNSEELKECRKQWQVNNREKWLEYRRGWERNRRKTDLKFNLNSKITGAINRSLKGNKDGRCWEDLVGYNLEDLIRRLIFTMPKDYNWQDYLNSKLEIDHIIPISAFNYTKSEHPDFKRCWALKNLQLLPSKENRIKHNKLKRPFQPALQLC